MPLDLRARMIVWAHRLRRRSGITRRSGQLAVGSAQITFVVVCGPLFDQATPYAGTKERLGWGRGFEQIGVPYVLLSVFELADRLPDLPSPICWISNSDYPYIDRRNLRALQACPHLVWVDTWYDGQAAHARTHDIPSSPGQQQVAHAVLQGDPLLFTISPESSFGYYHRWVDAGGRLVSLPLACDTSLYRPDVPHHAEFDDVQIAFVGGYWPYKARQLDPYLRPFEDRLRVYGYSAWPYASYGGRLADELEPALYRQARVAPTINEPYVSVLGVELNERVFKVLGSGGLTITDATPAYRAWFGADELMVPSDVDEFHAMIELVLSDETVNERFRMRGYEAVIARHTYAHRAREVLAHLGVAHGDGSATSP
jgi:hypothetical protein